MIDLVIFLWPRCIVMTNKILGKCTLSKTPELVYGIYPRISPPIHPCIHDKRNIQML